MNILSRLNQEAPYEFRVWAHNILPRRRSGLERLAMNQVSGTGAYVFKGKGRIYWGENYSEFIDMTEGDFVFVPPHMPHIEVNMSTTEELLWLTCRTPDNIVVNLPDIEDSVLVGYRRR